MRYSGLRFFNGTNYEVQLEYDSTSEVFEGYIHMDEVSTGLYESVSLFILEEAYNSLGASVLVKPVGSNIGSQFKLEWRDWYQSSKDINLVGVKLVDGDPYVETLTSQILDPQPNSVAVSTSSGIHTLGTSYAKDALQVNVALNSERDDSHRRDLYLIDTIDDHVVAIIHFYGETVGEDERLGVLLSNFGATLSTADQFLFKDHDINEVGTDWKLLNRKRKELLLELSNIKPFIGTYKALINAIKFFGYNNLTLKEYWLVVDDRSPMFGKLKAFEIPSSSKGSYVSNKLKGIQLPSSSYKKTSRFGLYYKLNTPNGNFDQWDTPQVDEVFDFTADEVLIKLYGLKNKLQREYLPLNAKIIDIIGEADFFYSYNTNIWNNQNPIDTIVAGVDPKIEIHQTEPFIEDLRLVSGLYTGKTQDFSSLSEVDMSTLYSDTEDFYTNYYELNRSTFQESFEDIPVGAPVQLECKSFPDTWEDAEFTWIDADAVTYLTWNNWWKRDVYETTWTITGPKGWSQVLTGETADMLKVAIALPYEGSYDVKIEHTNLFNHVSNETYPNSIHAKMKSLEIYGMYRWMDREYYDWQSSNFKWGVAGGSWGFPQQNNDTVDQEIGTLYLTLDRANYVNDDSQGVNFSTVRRYVDTSSTTGFGETPGPYFWRNLRKHEWNDGKHTWWDATRVGSDLTASFKIENADPGSSFTIEHFNYQTYQYEYSTYVFTVDLTDPTDIPAWQSAANDLNASTDPILSKFTYNPVFKDVDGDGIISNGIDYCKYILAVGKDYSNRYDFEDVYEAVASVGSVTITGKVNYTPYNPTFNDIQIAEAYAEIELLTHMTFSADKSMMPGKNKYRWTIRNNSTSMSDIYYSNKWLTYLFEDKGDYTLELEVTDVNGNTNTLVKNALTIK